MPEMAEHFHKTRIGLEKIFNLYTAVYMSKNKLKLYIVNQDSNLHATMKHRRQNPNTSLAHS